MTTSPVPIPSPDLPPAQNLPRAPNLPPPPRRELPRRFRGWARVTQGALIVCIAFAVVEIGQVFAQRELMTRVRDDASSARFSDVVESNDRASAMRGFWFLLIVVTAVVWLVWWMKAYRAASEGRGDLRYGARWTIWCWIVPIASLFIPKRVADDLWTAARVPGHPRDAGVVRSKLVLGWWLAFVVAGFCTLAVSGPDKTVDDVLAENAVRVFQLVLYMVAAFLALRVVAQITAGFASQVGVEPRTGWSSRTRLAVVAGVVVVAVATAAGSEALFASDAQTTTGVAVGHGILRYTPGGAHYSVSVPDTWVAMGSDDLPDGVTFAATTIDGNTAISVVEGPAGAALDPEQMRSSLADQFDLSSEVEETALSLPAGDATRYSFQTFADGTLMDGRVYVFHGVAYDHAILFLRPSALFTGSSTIDRIARSLRIESGQRS
ncbi:MAG TPA: DUF4328 domain-containing protein [Acidimicrobiia bacterium]|jgi:hypothetical protein